MSTNLAEPSQDAIDHLCVKLSAGESVDETIGGVGSLHFDRPHPYLCIHRRAEDDVNCEFDQLFAGLGATVILPSAAEAAPWQTVLLDRIAAIMTEKFGVFLLIEVWANSGPKAGEAEKKRIAFNIVTSIEGVEIGTLQALEAAFFEQSWHGNRPSCSVSYQEQPSPLGVGSMIDVINRDREKRFYLGLEIDPIYRDPESGDLRPEVLRDVSADLSRCIKLALYSFSKRKSTKKPKHFHQLGSRLVTDATLEADACLTRVGKSFDLVLYATPVNAPQAWEAFQASGFATPPEFHYRPLTLHLADLKRSLYQAPVDEIEDPALHYIFDERRTELDRQITMLGDRGTSKFLLGSQQVYGAPDTELLTTARYLLQDIAPPQAKTVKEKPVSAEHLAEKARDMVQAMRPERPLHVPIELRDDLPGIMVSDGHLLIGRQSKFLETRVAAVLNHEIGTHIVTHHNGSAQPFFHLQVGLAGYQVLQEGLAVFAEYLSGGLNRARIRQIAGRVIAVDLVTQGASFIDTFQWLKGQHNFGASTAYAMAMRVHRSGGFTKDAVYLQGVLEVQTLLQGGHKLENLLIGKFASSHVNIVEELRWRQILRPCSLLPNYLTEPGVAEKVRDVVQGKSIFENTKG